MKGEGEGEKKEGRKKGKKAVCHSKPVMTSAAADRKSTNRKISSGRQRL